MPDPDDKLREIMAGMPSGEYVHSAQLLLDMIDAREDSRVVHSDEERERHAVEMIDRIFKALTPQQRGEAIAMLEEYFKERHQE